MLQCTGYSKANAQFRCRHLSCLPNLNLKWSPALINRLSGCSHCHSNLMCKLKKHLKSCFSKTVTANQQNICFFHIFICTFFLLSPKKIHFLITRLYVNSRHFYLNLFFLLALFYFKYVCTYRCHLRPAIWGHN